MSSIAIVSILLSSPDNPSARIEMLKEMLGKPGNVWIQPPFYFCYGTHIYICWIGANVTICPGVTIGKNSVIGAGSVVIHDIPENSVAAGNPCKVIREIDEKDRQYYFKDRMIDKTDLEEEAKLRKKR